VIVEQQTGARYVLGQDGLLHPVLNYASARLLAGGSADQTVTVSADTLRSASRGAMVGIPGAPDSLPPAGSLSDTTFASCTRVPPDLPAAAPPVSTVVVGVGVGAASGTALPPGKGILVAPRAGGEYLVSAGHRFALPGQAPVAALGYEDITPLTVSDSWLDTVPAGRDLGLVAVPGAGAPGPIVAGNSTRVGQVLTDGAYYLVESDGVAPISPTEARLVLGDSANAAAYPDGGPVVLATSVAALDGAPRSRTPGAAGYPAAQAAPVVTDPHTVLCAVGDGTGAARITTADRVPLPSGAKAMRVTGSADDRVADEVYVAPGTGTLVREQVGAGGGTGSLYLITDAGAKYPVPSLAAAAALGYAGARPAPVAGTVLALLRDGPSLDPVAARQVVASGGGGR
jgi:type VII secretion protein EccB